MVVEYSYMNLTGGIGNFFSYPNAIVPFFWSFIIFAVFAILYMSNNRSVKNVMFGFFACTMASFFMMLLDWIPYEQFLITFIGLILMIMYGLSTTFNEEVT